MPPRADVPLSTPRARATNLGRGPNLRIGSGRAPCVPRIREHQERRKRKKCRRVKKTHFYICIYDHTRGLAWCHRSHTQMSHKLSQMMPRHTIENPKYIRYETPDLRRPISITAVSQTAPLLGPKYNTSRTNITNAR